MAAAILQHDPVCQHLVQSIFQVVWCCMHVFRTFCNLRHMLKLTSFELGKFESHNCFLAFDPFLYVDVIVLHVASVHSGSTQVIQSVVVLIVLHCFVVLLAYQNLQQCLILSKLCTKVCSSEPNLCTFMCGDVVSNIQYPDKGFLSLVSCMS